MQKILLDGQRFGMWLVIRDSGTRRNGSILWLCRCDCGTERLVLSANLRARSTNCGCAKRSDGSREYTYTSWRCMMRRCHDSKDKSYPKYGARGILVCDRWHKFDAFIEDMGIRPRRMELDRIDGTKGYEPGNVRWATHSEQMKNRTMSHKVGVFEAAVAMGMLLDGKTMRDIAAELRTTRGTLTAAIQRHVGPIRFRKVSARYRRSDQDYFTFDDKIATTASAESSAAATAV